MKIYNKVVIDMNSLEIIEEDSYEHEGEVSLCKGGGGGSASGAVSFPAYMEAIHSAWLNTGGVTALETDMVNTMNSALGNSPFTGATAYDPDIDLASMLVYVTDYKTAVDLLSNGTGLDDLVGTILDETRITDMVDAYDAELEDVLNTRAIPQFEAGMRDINSVMSSTFVIGKAVIEANRTMEVAKFSAQLRLKAGTDDAFRLIAMKLQYLNSLAALGVENGRIKIAAKSAENTQNVQYEESDAKWDLEIFQYGSNLLASISGAAHYVPNKEGKDAGIAIGGALSGAASGVAMGFAAAGATGGLSIPVGAILGGGLGYFASSQE